jgi:hypothetical protein
MILILLNTSNVNLQKYPELEMNGMALMNPPFFLYLFQAPKEFKFNSHIFLFNMPVFWTLYNFWHARKAPMIVMKLQQLTMLLLLAVLHILKIYINVVNPL